MAVFRVNDTSRSLCYPVYVVIVFHRVKQSAKPLGCLFGYWVTKLIKLAYENQGCTKGVGAFQKFLCSRVVSQTRVQLILMLSIGTLYLLLCFTTNPSISEKHCMIIMRLVYIDDTRSYIILFVLILLHVNCFKHYLRQLEFAY